MSSVSGKVVFITGGAAGVGAEVARRLHDGGAKLVLTDVDEDALAKQAAGLGADRVLTVGADVRDLGAMQAAAAAAVQRFGSIDVVVANAGIASYGSGRRRQVNCPRWVGAVRWLKPVLATPVGSAPVLKIVPDLLPRMDAEVAALGRSTSAHTEALEK
jgi:NAD(P)-dependent dehydrogenase (short-subunit alcohol dehydrogenase family)